MATKFSQDEISELKEAFNMINRRRDGVIIPAELAAAYRAFGFNPREEEIRDMFREVDTDADNMIDFTEFLTFMGKCLYDSTDEFKQISLQYAFQFFNKEGNGNISAREIKTIFRHFGETVSDEEVQKIIDVFDIDGNGTLSYEEFVAMMTGAKYAVEPTKAIKQSLLKNKSSSSKK